MSVALPANRASSVLQWCELGMLPQARRRWIEGELLQAPAGQSLVFSGALVEFAT
jgi:hypothetical protein